MAQTTTSSCRDENRRALALVALFAGATAIATSALFVKVSEAGPVSTGFWRVFLALPFLWGWALFGGRRQHLENFTRNRRLMIGAGLFFAGDLAVWHWSIVLTSVANATLLANLAPIFVTLAAWLLLQPVMAALFAWILLGETMGALQILGGVTVLAGIAIAHQAGRGR